MNSKDDGVGTRQLSPEYLSRMQRPGSFDIPAGRQTDIRPRQAQILGGLGVYEDHDSTVLLKDIANW